MSMQPYSITSEQDMFCNELVNSALLNKESKIILASAAPGSGKTATIIEAIRRSLEEIDLNGQKILVLVFNSEMKDEIVARLKESGINMDSLDIKTIHSLFFKATWKPELSDYIDKKYGTFSVDYTKSFFSKKMITEILSSLTVNGPKYDDTVDNLIFERRILSENILSNENIGIFYKYVNAYFSTTTKVNDFDKLTSISTFFSKEEERDRELSNLLIDKRDSKAILDFSNQSNIHDSPIYETLFKIVISQIYTLASLRKKIPTSEVKTKQFTTLVEEVSVDGVVTKKYNYTFRREHQDCHYEHIFKVPHNFYYKNFHTKALREDLFSKEVFSNYRLIVVDEAQDNDGMFFSIIKNVLHKNIVKTCAAVGDPNQAIYAFKSPDHFDIIDHVVTNEKILLDNYGIKTSLFLLDQTFRFGTDISQFINTIFNKSIIKGLESKSSYIYREPISIETATEFINNLPVNKKTNSAIICRTNNEALSLAISLMKRGCKGVKIHSKIKSDFTSFFKDGIKAIDDERLRATITEIFAAEGKTGTISSDDILHNDMAKKILISNGYGQYFKFDKEDINTYLSKKNSKETSVIITTAHKCKGSQFQYVFIANDFLKKELESHLYNDDIPYLTKPNLNNPVDFLMNYENADKNSNKELLVEQNPNNIIEIISNMQSVEERNTLYVALTRATTGMFFLEGELAQYFVPTLKLQEIDSKDDYDMIFSPLFVKNSLFFEGHNSTENNQIATSTRSLFD